MNIAEVRSKFPQYEDLSDQQLADALHTKFYSDIPKTDFYSKIGLSSTPQEQPISRGEAALTTLTNLPLVGMRGKAILAAGVAKGFGGDATKDQSFGNLYDEALAQEKNKLKGARDQYPIQSLTTEIGRDVATGGVLLKGLGLAGNSVKQVAAGSAALGGAQAVGETENASDYGQVAKDLAVGSSVGAAAGVAGQGLIAGAKYFGSSVSNLVKRLVKSREGEDILETVIPPEAASQALTKLKNAQSEGRVTLLPDVAGEEVAGLSRLLAKTNGSKNIINTALSNRTAQSSRRVANLINKNISSEAYFGNLDDIVKARAELSAPLYEQAYKEGKTIKKALVEPLVNDQRVTSAITKARTDFGLPENIKYNSVEALHGARQVIDDVIGTAQRTGENNKARAYIDLKNKINDVLYKSSPSLKQADETFSGFSALKNAQEQGLDFSKLGSADEIKRVVSGFTPGEKDAFRIGVKENLMRSVDKTVDSASAARKIFGNSLNREKLKVIFDNPKQYNDFSKRMLDEIRVFDTKQRILGGSRTDINLNDEAQIINKVAGGLISPKTAGVTNILGAVIDSIKKKYIGLNDENAKKLAQVITNQNKSIAALERIVSKIEPEQQQAAKQFVFDIIPVVLGKNIGAASTPNKENNQ